MELNIIVAAGRDGAIGRAGDLIWHISSDLKRFKTLTMGHPVIMGRKTWESLPKRPLPGRLNVVVSRQKGYEAPGALVVNSPQAALEVCSASEEYGGAAPFIIGGAAIYEAFASLATRLYLTQVDADCEDADAWLAIPSVEEWNMVERSEDFSTPEGLTYRFVTYSR